MAIPQWRIIALVVSVLVGVLKLTFFCKSPRTQENPAPAVLFVVLCTCASASIRAATAPTPTASNKHEQEPWLAFYSELFFTSAAAMWEVLLVRELTVTLTDPLLPYPTTALLEHHLIAWPGALSYCLFYWFVSHTLTKWKQGLAFRLVTYLVLLGIVVAALAVVVWRRVVVAKSGAFRAHAQTHTMAKRMYPYVAVFAIAQTVLFVLELVPQTPATHEAEELVPVVESLALAGLFGYDIGVWQAVRGKIQWHELGFAPHGDPRAAKMPYGSTDLARAMRTLVFRGVCDLFQQSDSHELTSSEQDDDTAEHDQPLTVDTVREDESVSFVHQMTAYSPRRFAHLRAQFGITTAQLLYSFEPTQNVDVDWDEHRFKTSLFETFDGQFVVQFVAKNEFETLQELLGPYASYMATHQSHTLLCRFLGSFSISLPMGTQPLHAIVMQHVFHGAGRIQWRTTFSGDDDAVSSSEWKEEEEEDDLAPILLPRTSRDTLLGQLRDDVAFLTDQRLVDYTLLVGASFDLDTVATAGRYDASDGETAYYVGFVGLLHRHHKAIPCYRWLWWILCHHAASERRPDASQYAAQLEGRVRARMVCAATASETQTELITHELLALEVQLSGGSVPVSPASHVSCAPYMAIEQEE